MTPSLRDFGGGASPPDPDGQAHDTRSERAAGRRRTYEHGSGRCRAISTAKACRCGGAALDRRDDNLCHYHSIEADNDIADGPETIDSEVGLVARWCGSRPTMWGEIPEACRAALLRVDPAAEGQR